jgi:hypothetical protein
MAYFAKLGAGNIVEQIISINNSVITDDNGVEQEQLGVDFINHLYKTNDVWKQTSYNSSFRKRYAGVGYSYDEQRNVFLKPKPFDSWLLNEETLEWEAPVVYPETYTLNLLDEQGNLTKDIYYWNENRRKWDLI